MGGFGFAGAEVFEVIQGRGKLGWSSREGGFHGGTEGFRIAFCAEVDDELTTFNGGIQISGEFGTKSLRTRLMMATSPPSPASGLRVILRWAISAPCSLR